MNFENCFPIWSKLTSAERGMFTHSAIHHKLSSGTLTFSASSDCLGLILIGSGRLRIFISSEDGKELTLFRLFPQDICLLSAACIVKDMELNISIEAEKPSEIWIMPSSICKEIMSQSITFSSYLNQIMFSRIAKILQLFEAVMWESVDKRLAAFLLEERHIEKNDTLKITHEKIANHMGTAREVVTRTLKAFQSKKLVQLSRGSITLTDIDQLLELSE